MGTEASKVLDPQEWIRLQRGALKARSSHEQDEQERRQRSEAAARLRQEELAKAFAPIARYINELVDAGVEIAGSATTPTVDVYARVPAELRRVGPQDNDGQIEFKYTRGASTQWEKVDRWGFGVRTAWKEDYRGGPERIVFENYDFGSYGMPVRLESEQEEPALERFLYQLSGVIVKVSEEDVALSGV